MEEAGAAPGTVEHVRRKLRAIFNAAKLPTNPAAEVAPRSTDPVNARATLTADEVPRMLQAARGWKRNLLAVAAFLAIRKGEAFALRRVDVDLDLGTITVRRSHRRSTTKGGHADTLPIPAPLWPFLVNQLALSDGSELLIPGADGEQLPEDFDTDGLVRHVLVHASIIDGYDHICRRCKGRGTPHIEHHDDGADRRSVLGPLALKENDGPVSSGESAVRTGA
jgi:integrase